MQEREVARPFRRGDRCAVRGVERLVVDAGRFVRGGLLVAHTAVSGAERTFSAIAASTPFTNRPEFSVEYDFASSTASSSTTAVGTSGLASNSKVATRNSWRSTTGMRSRAHSLEWREI